MAMTMGHYADGIIIYLYELAAGYGAGRHPSLAWVCGWYSTFRAASAALVRPVSYRPRLCAWLAMTAGFTLNGDVYGRPGWLRHRHPAVALVYLAHPKISPLPW